MADNYSIISLRSHKNKFVDLRKNARTGIDLLDNKTSDFAEHHQHLINTYNSLIDILDNAISDSKGIGKGR